MKKHEKVAEGLFRIRGSRSNIYLVSAETLVLIDTGMPGDEKIVLAAIMELGYRPEDVAYILITHAHLDHVGALGRLKQVTGAKVVAGESERDFIEGRRMLCSMKREGLSGMIFKAILFLLEKYKAKYEPVILDIPVCGDGREAMVAGFKIIPTPGHSMGSLSYQCLSKSALFAGDALTGVPVPGLPLRAGCADYKLALSSVRHISSLAFDRLLFGHGDPVTEKGGVAVRELLYLEGS